MPKTIPKLKFKSKMLHMLPKMPNLVGSVVIEILTKQKITTLNKRMLKSLLSVLRYKGHMVGPSTTRDGGNIGLFITLVTKVS